MPAAATKAPSKTKSLAVQRRRRRLAPQPGQEPLPDLVEEQIPDRPQEHLGIAIIREEPILSNLPTKVTIKISRLFLADGTTAYGCCDCLFTGDKRAAVMSHRNQTHSALFGKRTPRLIFPKDKVGPDLVLPERKDASPPPNDIMEWTLAELLAMVPSIQAFGDLIDRAESERDEAMAELEQRRADADKAAVYDSLHDEVLDLRMMIKSTGSYEKLRAEVLELRAWKKKTIAKLAALGFQFTEEDH